MNDITKVIQGDNRLDRYEWYHKCHSRRQHNVKVNNTLLLYMFFKSLIELTKFIKRDKQ